jgi:hypothetical protein
VGERFGVRPLTTNGRLEQRPVPEMDWILEDSPVSRGFEHPGALNEDAKAWVLRAVHNLLRSWETLHFQWDLSAPGRGSRSPIRWATR